MTIILYNPLPTEFKISKFSQNLLNSYIKNRKIMNKIQYIQNPNKYKFYSHCNM